MVEFNIEEDGRFLTSLEDLGLDGEIDVLKALEDIASANLAWKDFVEMYGWVQVVWQGDNTYPGAMELYTFAVEGPSGTIYQIAGSCVNEKIVVCSVATRKAESGRPKRRHFIRR